MSMNDFYQFENLVKDLFRFQTFEVSNENKRFRINNQFRELDFSVSIQNKIYAVEVKFYRQSFQNTSLLKNSAQKLLSIMKKMY